VTAARRSADVAEPTAPVRLVRMRWWHLDDVLSAEGELFGDEAWSAALFWSELAQTETCSYLCAVDPDDAVLGYGGLAAYPSGGEAYVQNLAVLPAAQGRGIGAALLDALLALADGAGIHTVGLEVRADNERAQLLYRRRGFSAVAVRRSYYQPSGADALVMVRQAGGEP
jgi:[ribosomal protein S18]-alanine N-acetyltransferase